jgi:hypothetical protein
MGESLLISITRPFALNDDIRKLPANLDRAVRTERIYYDNFIAPS